MAAFDHHPDRIKWNEKYRARPALPASLAVPFPVQPLAQEIATIADLPAGPVLELACGLSGNALFFAEQGRAVLAIDIADVALAAQAAEAARRSLTSKISFEQADLDCWQPHTTFAIVLAVHYWQPALFVRVCAAVLPAGIIGWETFTLRERQFRPGFAARWCLQADEPARLLPADFCIIDQCEIDDGRKRRLIARRQ